MINNLSILHKLKTFCKSSLLLTQTKDNIDTIINSSMSVVENPISDEMFSSCDETPKQKLLDALNRIDRFNDILVPIVNSDDICGIEFPDNVFTEMDASSGLTSSVSNLNYSNIGIPKLHVNDASVIVNSIKEELGVNVRNG